MAVDTNKAGMRQRALLGLVITLAVLALGIYLGVHWPRLVEPDVAERISYALHWSLLLAFSLIMAMIRLAQHRYNNLEELESGVEEAVLRSAVLRSCLHNTLEQVTLTFIIYLVWAVLVPADWLMVIPTASGLFLVGRLLFFYGYSDGPQGRVLGFALTFYPTLVMFIVSILYILFSYSYFYFT